MVLVVGRIMTPNMSLLGTYVWQGKIKSAVYGHTTLNVPNLI